MVNSKGLIGVCIAALLVVVLVFVLLPNKEKQVRKRLRQLVEYVSREADEPPLASLQKGRRIGLFFADPCRVILQGKMDEKELRRKEITDRVVLIRNTYSQLQVKFHDVSIVFPAETTADIHMTMRLTGVTAGSDMADVQEVEARMKKLDGEWLFTDVTLVEVLAR